MSKTIHAQHTDVHGGTAWGSVGAIGLYTILTEWLLGCRSRFESRCENPADVGALAQPIHWSFRKGHSARVIYYGRHIIFFSPIAAAGGAPVVLRILHQRRHLPALAYYDDLDGV